MAPSMRSGGGKYYMVGDYIVGRQIGSGSFSTVWHARHRVHGTEVAIKEIVTAKLNSKLQESLKSEIFILKKINHPNIIRLHDMIEEPDKIYIILEYCKGGDLSMYIQQRIGRIPGATAMHFMQHLAAGLNIMRKNNLIHRDLKPQNLLLSTDDENAVLKIADFGFARFLQHRVLAETFCGSPLYMAPEIMQLQKYDAKADLWSVGAILFQLVTGKTPYTGNNQIQLLDNIKKSTELQFPPEAKNLNPDCMDLCRKLLRSNPVERLTFEEFFHHPYLSQGQPHDPVRNKRSERAVDNFPFSERNPVDGSQEDCLPFSLDDDSSGLHSRPSLLRTSPMRSTYGFSPDKREVFSLSNKGDFISNFNSAPRKTEIPGSSLGSRRLSEGNLKGSRKTLDFRQNTLPKDVDSFESIDQEYVLVPGPPADLSSSAHASMQSHLPSKSGSPPLNPVNMTSTPSAPVPIIGAATGRVGYTGSLESRSSAPGTSQGSMDTGDTFEKPSTDFMTRIKSLQRCASAITDLVREKIEAGKQLEAFSIQLETLAIWKQALYICHTRAASATEGSPIQERIKFKEISKVQHSPDVLDCSDDINTRGPMDIHSQIERAFVHEVGCAEELAKVIEPGNMDLPDAMELIYQSALDLGKRAAVREYMGDTENAVIFYSKAVCILVFILVEAPCLILNPPFSLTNTEHCRIQNYIDALVSRENSLRC